MPSLEQLLRITPFTRVIPSSNISIDLRLVNYVFISAIHVLDLHANDAISLLLHHVTSIHDGGIWALWTRVSSVHGSTITARMTSCRCFMCALLTIIYINMQVWKWVLGWHDKLRMRLSRCPCESDWVSTIRFNRLGTAGDAGKLCTSLEACAYSSFVLLWIAGVFGCSMNSHSMLLHLVNLLLDFLCVIRGHLLPLLWHSVGAYMHMSIHSLERVDCEMQMANAFISLWQIHG